MLKKPKSFEKLNGLSSKQGKIVSQIIGAIYRDNDKIFISMLPVEVLTIAKKSNTYWKRYLNSDIGTMDKAKEYDNQLAQMVKKYWDKNGMAISQ